MISAMCLISVLNFAQPFPNRTVNAGNLNLNYGLAANTITTAATAYTVTENNYAIITTTDLCVFSLPTPSLVANGKIFLIKSSGAATASVNVIGGANIDAASSKTISAGKCLQVQSSGNQYWIMSYNKFENPKYLYIEENNKYAIIRKIRNRK